MTTDLTERGMRKKEQAMDRGECLELLKRVEVGRLGLTDGEAAYVVPINFTLLDERIYTHGAAEGLKMDLIKQNNRVCFEADEFYGIKRGKKACEYSSRYRSIIAFGRARAIDSRERKMLALKELMKKHTGSEHWPDLNLEAAEKVTVLEITIEKMSGKKANV